MPPQPVLSPAIQISSTKLEILRQIGLRKMTVSELARSLGIDRAAVFRHLAALQGAGFVLCERSHRKWVYYLLQPAGEDLVKRADSAVETPR